MLLTSSSLPTLVLTELEFSIAISTVVVHEPSVFLKVPVFTNLVPAGPLKLYPMVFRTNVPLFSKIALLSAKIAAAASAPLTVTVPVFLKVTSFKYKAPPEPFTLAATPDSMTKVPGPDILPPPENEPVTSTSPAIVNEPPLITNELKRDTSSARTPANSSDPPANTSVPLFSRTSACSAPETIVTVFPDPIHATSLEVGTLPADQLTDSSQIPSLGPVHVSVHSGSAAAFAAPKTKTTTSRVIGTQVLLTARPPATKRTRLPARASDRALPNHRRVPLM